MDDVPEITDTASLRMTQRIVVALDTALTSPEDNAGDQLLEEELQLLTALALEER